MTAALLLFQSIPAAHAQIGSSRYAAVVMDAGSGEELYAINADEPRYPASLTKMMTLYLTFEALDRGRLRLTSRIRVSRHAAGQEPSKLGLKPGTSITVRDAILALVTKSANDVASALGENLAGGSEVAFGRIMTRKARQLGMRNTSFRNASGLPDANQVTTARDIAILGRALIRDFPKRYAYFNARHFAWHGRSIGNHNNLLGEYDGADGIKTGYIRASGFNLAASAVRGDTRLIAVVFGGATTAERDGHVMALLDRGFAQRRRSTDMLVASAGPQLIGTAHAAALAAPPLPRPTKRATPRKQQATAATKGGWAVQVGAFASSTDARRVAQRAARRLGTAHVERVRVDGKWFYRAQVTGLSASTARSACRARRGPCMVVAP
ncbi:D-alanyl-D-alanine carboxypeptidase family protein [Roseomonas sp. E05]|uniref:D-alanyl-D-alanine carboxypeptidase family protein n=1 Tax=Roseomonas sp. E05 TaxID=3046310 RepID=UPI0024B89E8E|nr:D-alanyl-D-alanine carboxypeptidase family protein [Roseomonas sp. E05]MDJ0391422.1 D-alanyl-D-alanine carboxypeptidase family protein [Roseomonas sp. E05]